MLLNLLLLITLVLFSLLTSQPLFYFLALSEAQKKLAAPSYIELRKLLDKHLKSKLRFLYYTTAFCTIVLLGLSIAASAPMLVGTATLALVTLVADMLIAVKRNIPINTLINSWNSDAIPRHWALIRRKWFYFFGIRQIVSIAGFLSLLAGAVFK